MAGSHAGCHATGWEGHRGPRCDDAEHLRADQRRRHRRFGDLVADDFVEHQGGPGFPATKEGTLDFFRALLDAFPDLRMDVEDVIADGDKTVARVTTTGTHRGDFMGIPPTGSTSTCSSSTSCGSTEPAKSASTGGSRTCCHSCSSSASSPPALRPSPWQRNGRRRSHQSHAEPRVAALLPPDQTGASVEALTSCWAGARREAFRTPGAAPASSGSRSGSSPRGRGSRHRPPGGRRRRHRAHDPGYLGRAFRSLVP